MFFSCLIIILTHSSLYVLFTCRNDEVIAAAGLNFDPAVSAVAERLSSGKVITKKEAQYVGLSLSKNYLYNDRRQRSPQMFLFPTENLKTYSFHLFSAVFRTVKEKGGSSLSLRAFKNVGPSSFLLSPTDRTTWAGCRCLDPHLLSSFAHAEVQIPSENWKVL